MSRILIASDSADLRGKVATAVGAPISAIAGTALPAGPPQLFQRLGAGAPIPQVVVIDTAAGPDDALALSSRLAAECPGMAVVLVTDQPDTLALPALRAGACDVVHPEATCRACAACARR